VPLHPRAGKLEGAQDRILRIHRPASGQDQSCTRCAAPRSAPVPTLPGCRALPGPTRASTRKRRASRGRRAAPAPARPLRSSRAPGGPRAARRTGGRAPAASGCLLGPSQPIFARDERDHLRAAHHVPLHRDVVRRMRVHRQVRDQVQLRKPRDLHPRRPRRRAINGNDPPSPARARPPRPRRRPRAAGPRVLVHVGRLELQTSSSLQLDDSSARTSFVRQDAALRQASHVAGQHQARRDSLSRTIRRGFMMSSVYASRWRSSARSATRLCAGRRR